MKHTTSRPVDLGRDPIKGLLLKLALPAITAQLINVLYNMVDRMYIGHIDEIGSKALTGLGVTMPLILCISAFAALVSMGGAPRASIMLGKQNQDEAERILGNCTAMLIFVAVVLTVLIQVFGKKILMMFGASDDTINYAWSYMQVYSIGTLSVQLALGLNAFINAQGFAKIGMYTVLIGAVCNIILDPIFIFAFKMGVVGAALATIISQTISCVWILVFLIGKKTKLRLKLRNFIPKASVILPCLALGVSPFIMQFTESVLNVSFNTSLLKYGGDIAVGAMTILTSVMQFMVLPLQGLGQGSQPIVGYNYGAGQNTRVKETFRLLVRYCFAFSAFMWLLCMIVPQLFVRIFTAEPELITYTKWALRVYMGSGLLLGIQLACQQTFVSLGKAKSSVFLALLRKVILLIPLIFILPHFIANQVFAVYLAEPIADLISVTVTAAFFAKQYKEL